MLKSISSSVLSRLNCCQHASYITNKYTGEKIRVDCGVCDYCIAKKAQKASLRVKTAASNFKYSYFVTLTYNNDNIPLYHVKCLRKVIDFVDGESGRFAYDEHEVLPLSMYHPDDPERLCHVFFDQVQGTIPYDRELKKYVPESTNWFLSYNAICSFVNKAKNASSYAASEKYGEDLIPFINYVDVQNYVKRLRKHLSNYTDEKISFYAVSEYGPVHFRPHFHLLLFFNSDEITKVLSECHHKSWKLGRSDIQRATGGAASYVSSYVNSLSSAPLLYRSCKGFKPKSRASNGFFEKGMDFDEADDPYAQIDKKLDSCINGRDYIFGGIVVRSTPPLSYLRTILPRFSSVKQNDCDANFGIISAVATASLRMARYGIVDYSDSVMSIVNAYCRYLFLVPEFCLSDFDKRIIDQARVSTVYSMCLYNEKFMLKVYRLFLSVQNFLRSWNFPLLGNDCSAYYRRIKYILKTGYVQESQRQLDCLNNDYKLLTESSDVTHSMLFYDSEFPQESFHAVMFEHHDMFDYFESFNRDWIRRSTKHKELSDANGVLNNMN